MKTTVKDLIERLKKMPLDYEIVIYPKYANIDRFKKHTIKLENVCEQHPYAEKIKNDKNKMIEYFGKETNIKDYQVCKHVAIIF